MGILASGGAPQMQGASTPGMVNQGFDVNSAMAALGMNPNMHTMGAAPGAAAPAQAGGGGMPPTQNPLAAMLAGQGPQYQPPDTRWGMAGDRLLRYTPQQGNAGMAAGGAGGGGSGGGAGGGNNVSNPGSGLGPGVQINWDNLNAMMAPDRPDQPNTPEYAAAQSGYGGKVTGTAPTGGVALPDGMYGKGAYRVPGENGMATDYGAPGSQFAKMYPNGLKTGLYVSASGEMPPEVIAALSAAAKGG